MVKIVLNRANVSSEILKSDAMEKACRDVANEIKSRAGSKYQVESGMHSKRAYANVGDPTDGAIYREAETGTLARILTQMGVSPRTGRK